MWVMFGYSSRIKKIKIIKIKIILVEKRES
jgi:hypothetical protein